MSWPASCQPCCWYYMAFPDYFSLRTWTPLKKKPASNLEDWMWKQNDKKHPGQAKKLEFEIKWKKRLLLNYCYYATVSSDLVSLYNYLEYIWVLCVFFRAVCNKCNLTLFPTLPKTRIHCTEINVRKKTRYPPIHTTLTLHAVKDISFII